MSSPTILVVEDEISFVEALTIGLKREGFRVEVATDGFEALDRFDAIKPDLVLLDVMLPRVSGIDVCRQLRKRAFPGKSNNPCANRFRRCMAEGLYVSRNCNVPMEKAELAQ